MVEYVKSFFQVYNYMWRQNSFVSPFDPKYGGEMDHCRFRGDLLTETRLVDCTVIMYSLENGSINFDTRGSTEIGR